MKKQDRRTSDEEFDIFVKEAEFLDSDELQKRVDDYRRSLGPVMELLNYFGILVPSKIRAYQQVLSEYRRSTDLSRE